jgi:hypothetical protein
MERKADTMLLLLGGFLLLMLLGLPVALSMATSSLVYILVTGITPDVTLAQRMIAGVESFPLLAVPFFILAGNLMNIAGVTGRIYKFAVALVGWMRGGLGHVRLESPHRVVFLGLFAAAAGTIVLGLLVFPGRRVGVVLANSLIALAAAATDGPLVADVGRAEAAGGESAEVLGRLDDDSRFAHPPGLHAGHHPAARAAVALQQAQDAEEGGEPGRFAADTGVTHEEGALPRTLAAVPPHVATPGIRDVGAVELADPVVRKASPAADRARARLVAYQAQGEVEPESVARVAVVGDAHGGCLDDAGWYW